MAGGQARQMMRYRARVVRPQDIGRDEWGGEIPDAQPNPHLDAMPCYAWAPTDARHVLDGSDDGVFGALRLAVPLGTDLSEMDLVEEISTRQGDVVFEGPMRVTAVTRRAGHLAVMVRTVRSPRTAPS